MPFIQANYKRIHYAEFAAPESPTQTFVLIHGLGSSQNYYSALAAFLKSSQPSARIIALDTTGQGRSPYTFIEQSIQSLATDIIDAMDALKIDKAVVVGHSMAGITVPHLTATWPARVTAAVLLGPVYPSEAAHPTFNARIEAVEKGGMQPMADTVPGGAVGSKTGPLVKAFIRELLIGTDPAGYVSMCRVIVGAAQTVPAYSDITCPVLIIAGEEDKSAPLAGCEKILGALGSNKKEIQVQKGLGHWMAVEDPEDCAQRIAAFVGK